MSTQIDMLAFDYHARQQDLRRYEDENGEEPYGLVIDNVTVWDLVMKSSEAVGGDLAEELFRHGFAERQIGGLRVLAVAGLDKGATLVDEAAFKEALKEASKNDGD
jgi:hypothetical protein